MGAAALAESLAGAVQRSCGIAFRDGGSQGIEVQNVTLAVDAVFLSAADVRTDGTDLLRVLLDEGRAFDQKLLQLSGCIDPDRGMEDLSYFIKVLDTEEAKKRTRRLSQSRKGAKESLKSMNYAQRNCPLCELGDFARERYFL